jgi:hypothetical protein
MNSGGQEPSKLDLYIDGMLPADQRRAFEEEMERQPQVRAQLEAQRRIDDSLKRTMVAPRVVQPPKLAATAAASATAGTHREPSSGWRLGNLRRSPWMAIAAMLIIGVSAWRVWDMYSNTETPPDEYVGRTELSMDQIYHVEKKRGFVPMWVCRDDKEFATTFYRNLGAALTFGGAPNNVASLGLSYGYIRGLSPKTVYMLFKIDGREVIVFIDHRKNDRQPQITTPGMKLFRRESGDFVLYEMTPFDKPQVFQLFRPYDIPEEWKSL